MDPVALKWHQGSTMIKLLHVKCSEYIVILILFLSTRSLTQTRMLNCCTEAENCSILPLADPRSTQVNGISGHTVQRLASTINLTPLPTVKGHFGHMLGSARDPVPSGSARRDFHSKRWCNYLLIAGAPSAREYPVPCNPQPSLALQVFL